MKYTEKDLSPMELQYLTKILEITSKLTGVTIEEFSQRTRGKESLALARQLYFYLADKYKPFAIHIGKFGVPVDRDHATVLYGIKTIKKFIDIKDKAVITYIHEFYKHLEFTEYTVSSEVTLRLLESYTAAILSVGTDNTAVHTAKKAREYMLETLKVHTQKEKYGIE